ncbi:MAG TPA: amidase [Pseudonocardiaceae bacterium]|nr:amidase [Pseudonocardiaceae bacterium]
MRHPADVDLTEASEALHAGALSAVELTEACLERIARRDPAYGAWIRVYEDEARAAAKAADEIIAAGAAGPLTGIPIGLKDVIGVAGLPLTADSAVLEGNVAAEDSTVWARLREAGMVLLGHQHCGEFASGTWGVNPWGSDFTPGGSSSGGGIALAARMVPASVGTDGRGSIRMPAAFNGVTGVKPTFGLVSTAGCVPITYTYDTLGPMARSAADCSLLLRAMAGRDERDRATLAQPADPGPFPTSPRPGPRPLAGVRIGIPRFPLSMSDGVAAVFDRCQRELTGLGAELVPFDWPENPLDPEIGRSGDWMHILGAELMYIHEQFVDRAHLYRDYWTSTMPSYESVGSAVDYVRAQGKRAEHIATWHGIFARYRLTAVVHPAALRELVGAQTPVDSEDFPPMVFGVWNDVNFPVVAVPSGRSGTDGSPVSMQIVGTPYTDTGLLQLAIDYQSATEHHREQPSGLDTAPAYQGPERKEAVRTQKSFVAKASPTDPLIPVPPSAGCRHR